MLGFKSYNNFRVIDDKNKLPVIKGVPVAGWFTVNAHLLLVPLAHWKLD